MLAVRTYTNFHFYGAEQNIHKSLNALGYLYLLILSSELNFSIFQLITISITSVFIEWINYFWVFLVAKFYG